jgi:hypothetical protein
MHRTLPVLAPDHLISPLWVNESMTTWLLVEQQMNKKTEAANLVFKCIGSSLYFVGFCSAYGHPR